MDCKICLQPLLLASAVDPGLERVRVKCGHAFHVSCLALHVSTKCKEAEERANADLAEAEAHLALERGDSQPVLGASQSLIALRANGRVRQCPQCGYGPVVNLTCADMRAHDQVRGSGEARTTNSCPLCEFFSPDWSDWDVWNATDPTSAARCPLCRDACCISQEDISLLTKCLDDADQRLCVVSELEDVSRELAEDLLELVFFLQRGTEANALPFLTARPEYARRLRANSNFWKLLRSRISVENDNFPWSLCGAARNCRIMHLNRSILQEARTAFGMGGHGEWHDAQADLFGSIREHRRHIALLLYTAKQHVAAEVVSRLGQPIRELRQEGAAHAIGEDSDDNDDIMFNRRRFGRRRAFAHAIEDSDDDIMLNRHRFGRRRALIPAIDDAMFIHRRFARRRTSSPRVLLRRGFDPTRPTFSRFLQCLPCFFSQSRNRVGDRRGEVRLMQRLLEGADPGRWDALEARLAPGFSDLPLPAQIG